MNKGKQPVFTLDAEEQALSDSFDRDEWVSVPNLKAEKVEARKAAAHYFRKDARINIRICEIDLEHIRAC